MNTFGELRSTTPTSARSCEIPGAASAVVHFGGSFCQFRSLAAGSCLASPPTVPAPEEARRPPLQGRHTKLGRHTQADREGDCDALTGLTVRAHKLGSNACKQRWPRLFEHRTGSISWSPAGLTSVPCLPLMPPVGSPAASLSRTRPGSWRPAKNASPSLIIGPSN